MMVSFTDLKREVYRLMLDNGFNIITDYVPLNGSVFGFKVTKGFNKVFEYKTQDYYIKENEAEVAKRALTIALDKFNRYDYWIYNRGVKVYKEGIFQCQTLKTLNELGENYHYDYNTNEIVYDKPIVVATENVETE